jgi:purine catabolism regulator
MEEPYLYVLFQHDHKSMDIRTKRNTVMDLFLHCGMESKGRMAFLSRTEGVILFHTRGNIELERRQISAVLTEFQSKMTRKFEGMEWTFAVSYEPKRLSEIRLCVEKGRKTLKIGSVAFPDQKILDYNDLGILTWLDIPDEELKLLLDDFSALMKAEKNRELLHTLKVYLENNMNYSLTAEKLYVNINTIRRRIEKVNELVNVDWNNYYTRIKIGLMLQFMQF